MRCGVTCIYRIFHGDLYLTSWVFSIPEVWREDSVTLSKTYLKCNSRSFVIENTLVVQ